VDPLKEKKSEDTRMGCLESIEGSRKEKEGDENEGGRIVIWT
jgi:hypothetical protein